MHSPSKKSSCTLALEELKRRDDLEKLRVFLIQEQCFPTQKNPETSVITMEELKKLARAWKLNERRNFWKNHSDKNDMVVALLQYADDNQKTYTKKASSPIRDSSHGMRPLPPAESRSSASKFRPGQGVIGPLKNICGTHAFFREKDAQEMLMNARFYDFPSERTNTVHQVEAWRLEDFTMKDESGGASPTRANQSIIAKDTKRASLSMSDRASAKSKMKLHKVRNLATHLMNYSSSPDLDKKSITIKAVQTFINVAETEDSKTVSHCIIGISNISSEAHVRALLLEINALHKVGNMLSNVRGKAAARAAALLFYYFSCDNETEDRVYAVGAAVLAANGMSKDADTRLLALYSLNNLLPCIDRLRVAETVMKLIHSNFDPHTSCHDKQYLGTLMLVMQNMSSFSNVHPTILHLKILDTLTTIVDFAVSTNNAEIGMGAAKILFSFMSAQEQSMNAHIASGNVAAIAAQNASNVVTPEFVELLVSLLSIRDNEALLLECLKVAVGLTYQPSLRPIVRELRLINTVCALIMDTEPEKITANLARDMAKFLLNVTVEQTETHMTRLVITDRVPEAILHLLRAPFIKTTAKHYAVLAVQNILTFRDNCLNIAPKFFEPLVRFMKSHHDLAAARSIFNVACVPECRATLVEHSIHFRILEFLAAAQDVGTKAAYLRILVQMSSSDLCIKDLLKTQLIAKLEAQIHTPGADELMTDISLMLLAVVAFAADQLSIAEQQLIVDILSVICGEKTAQDVIENCSNVLRYVSVNYNDFAKMGPLVTKLLDLARSEDVVDCLSTVLYNMTCSKGNIAHMLKDSFYVNMMIRIMRNGKVEIQENIALAMRTLCSEEKCVNILLKNDILSDLIVVALLRTSSEEIKHVCSETFYNMFCHPDTRKRLLKGDLWWAIMRLCRTDSNKVRTVCARTLFDLSCAGDNIEPLREHHVLSFVKDIFAMGGNEEFLRKCMCAVHNIIRHFEVNEMKKSPSNDAAMQSESLFNAHEITACVRIGADALSRGTTVSTVRDAISLLLKSAQHCHTAEAVGVFVNVDVVTILQKSKSLWGRNNDCRRNVSRLLWELSKSHVFCKSTDLSQMEPVFSMSYVQNPPFEICDNIVCTFLQYVILCGAEPSAYIDLPVWELILSDALSCAPGPTALRARADRAEADGANLLLSSAGAVSSNLLASAADNSGGGGGGGGGISKNSSIGSLDRTPSAPQVSRVGSSRMPRSSFYATTFTAKANAATFATQIAVLSLVSHAIEEIIKRSKESLTKSLIQGMLTTDLMESPHSRMNLLNIIQAMSADEGLAGSMVDCGVFKLMSYYLSRTASTKGFTDAQQFCSNLLKNMSLHTSLIPRYITTPNGCLLDLIRELLDIHNAAVSLDISTFFYNSSGHLVRNDASLSPKFLLDMVAKISSREEDKESDVSNINKFTISLILNKYQFGSGVEPLFVQSMYTYIQTGKTTSVQEMMSALKHCTLPCIAATLSLEYISNKKSLPIMLEEYFPDEFIWKPTTALECRRSSNIILKLSQAIPLAIESGENWHHNNNNTADRAGRESFSSIVSGHSDHNHGHGHSHSSGGSSGARTRTTSASGTAHESSSSPAPTTFSVLGFFKIVKHFDTVKGVLGGGVDQAAINENDEEDEDDDEDDDDDEENGGGGGPNLDVFDVADRFGALDASGGGGRGGHGMPTLDEEATVTTTTTTDDTATTCTETTMGAHSVLTGMSHQGTAAAVAGGGGGAIGTAGNNSGTLPPLAAAAATATAASNSKNAGGVVNESDNGSMTSVKSQNENIGIGSSNIVAAL